MSRKKKVQHKGKPKHATTESEDFAFTKNVTENTQEEYTTVVDFESNKKYNKRLIESNWSKYEANVSDFSCADEQEKGEEQLPKTDDFSYLLKTASSDCSHFQFSSEKLWKTESNSVAESKIFNLDLNVLSSGLACVPFYERMGLNENELSVEDKEKFDKAAENSWKEYLSIRDKLIKKPEVKNTEKDLHILEESLQVSLDLGSHSEVSEKNSDKSELGATELSVSEVEENKSKKKVFLSENDENLEDWLDSVLDD